MSFIELGLHRGALQHAKASRGETRPLVAQARMTCRDVNVYYGDNHAVQNVSLDIHPREVLAFIGPSGCGKSTLLRCFNRMNENIPGCRATGEIRLDGEDIQGAEMDVVPLRLRVGMVFQKPNPFPKSVYDNVALGPQLHGLVKTRADTDAAVEAALLQAGLWDEVKDRLQLPATGLSGGQQQRLCIARTLAVQPEIILMDEPCSALDPIATAWIERTIEQLSSEISIVIVTHSMQQAARLSKRTAFFHLGKLIELGDTEQVFTRPQVELTERYITGLFG